MYAFPKFSRLLTFKSPIVCQEEIKCDAIKECGRPRRGWRLRCSQISRLFLMEILPSCGSNARRLWSASVWIALISSIFIELIQNPHWNPHYGNEKQNQLHWFVRMLRIHIAPGA
jgi:hypothetical protein